MFYSSVGIVTRLHDGWTGIVVRLPRRAYVDAYPLRKVLTPPCTSGVRGRFRVLLQSGRSVELYALVARCLVPTGSILTYGIVWPSFVNELVKRIWIWCWSDDGTEFKLGCRVNRTNHGPRFEHRRVQEMSSSVRTGPELTQPLVSWLPDFFLLVTWRWPPPV